MQPIGAILPNASTCRGIIVVALWYCDPNILKVHHIVEFLYVVSPALLSWILWTFVNRMRWEASDRGPRYIVCRGIYRNDILAPVVKSGRVFHYQIRNWYNRSQVMHMHCLIPVTAIHIRAVRLPSCRSWYGVSYPIITHIPSYNLSPLFLAHLNDIWRRGCGWRRGLSCCRCGRLGRCSSWSVRWCRC